MAAARRQIRLEAYLPVHVVEVEVTAVYEGMLAGNTLGVVVGNYSPELEKLRKYPRIYFASATHASAIIEGIEYYNFLEKITIPNEKPVEENVQY